MRVAKIRLSSKGSPTKPKDMIYSFTIETKKSKEEVLRIIKEQTSCDTPVFWNSIFGNNGKQYFNGKVSEDSFKISRKIWYQNSFLPIIIGEVEENGSGSRTSIKMRMNLFVIAFLLFSFGFLIVRGNLLTSAIAFGAIAIIFYIEVKIVKKKLLELLSDE